MKDFWMKWRREIVRGGLLFGTVVALGLLVINAKNRVTAFGRDLHLPDNMDFNFDDLDSSNAHVGDEWHYVERLGPNQRVWIRNLNGPIEVLPSHGDSLEVTAVKLYRESAPSTVQLVANPVHGGVVVCALYEGGSPDCSPDSEIRQAVRHSNGGRRGGPRHSDVAVRFHIHLPRGASIDASTMHGDVKVAGSSAAVNVRTVDGSVDAETEKGSLEAHSVNGRVRGAVWSLGDSGGVDIVTVNGEVDLALPAELNAHVEAGTVKGSIESAFPLPQTTKLVLHHLEGNVGAGRNRVHVQTVNGSINITKSEPKPTGSPSRGKAPTAGTPKPSPGTSAHRSAS